MTQESKGKKKVYASPNLVEWGTIHDITKGPAGGSGDEIVGSET